MNDIIGWLAANNTWMIRFGFTAVIILIGVYLFRNFFIAKSNAVSEAEKNDVKEKKEVGEQQASTVELEKKYQTEVDSLKKQASELALIKEENQKLVAQLDQQKLELEQLKTQQLSVTQNNADFQAVSELQETTAEDSSGLHKKIQELQARLAEYEIIAEDISEIGQLRQDNEELRKKIAELAGAEQVAITVSASAESVAQEMTKEDVTQATAVETEYVNSSDQLLDEMLAEHESGKVIKQESSSYADIPDVPTMKSEKPVTATEQQMLNQFEESQAKKVSS